jgi:hypothetical protein
MENTGHTCLGLLGLLRKLQESVFASSIIQPQGCLVQRILSRQLSHEEGHSLRVPRRCGIFD